MLTCYQNENVLPVALNEVIDSRRLKLNIWKLCVNLIRVI